MKIFIQKISLYFLFIQLYCGKRKVIGNFVKVLRLNSRDRVLLNFVKYVRSVKIFIHVIFLY